MCQMRVVIADPNEEFPISLSQALSPDFLTEICSDGAEALALIRQWEPDILVTELILPNMDGIALIRQAAALPKPPKVMVVSRMISEFVHYALADMGIQYAMMKPCLVSAAAERIRQIAAARISLSPLPNQYGVLAGEVLMELGISNERLGFQHMLVGIPMLMTQRDRRLSKELYADIAAQCGSSPIRVEKTIRDAIHAGWESRDSAVWNKFFPGAVRCPKNKEFLFRLTDILMERTLRKVI